MAALLSPRQFADAIGVSESSIRRWADDGRIKMTKTAGGHRKIALAEAIRFVRETNANVVRPDLLEFAEPPHRRQRGAAFAAQHEQLFEALVAGDRAVVSGLLARMYVNGVSAAEICDGPIRTAMRRIGDLWPSDKRAIFIEHRATDICIDALHRLQANFAPPEGEHGVAVGGAPESDPYILPSLMAATVLAERGFRPINLGPNTPLEVLVDAATEMDARLAWLALTAPLPQADIKRQLDKASQQLKRRKIHLALGGQATHRYRIREAKYVHVFTSMCGLSDFMNEQLSATPARHA